MLAFISAFAAALLLGMGARDQMLVAGLSLRLGKRISLLIVALTATALTSALAIWAGETLALPASPLFAGLALIFAGLEMIMRRPGALPAEPTRSLGAMGLAFALVQTDQTPDTWKRLLAHLADAGQQIGMPLQGFGGRDPGTEAQGHGRNPSGAATGAGAEYTVLPKAVRQGLLMHISLTYPRNVFTPAEREAMETARDSLLNTIKDWSFS